MSRKEWERGLEMQRRITKALVEKGLENLPIKLFTTSLHFVGLAIRGQANSIEGMKQKIWATFFHKCSPDENPQRQNCPTGEDSWSKRRKAEAQGELDSFHHEKAPLTEEVQTVIKPIYEDLSRDDLLNRCLGAETQNNNESLNALIWTYALKHLHSGAKVVEIATFLAVIIFNEGFNGILKILVTMGCQVGHICQVYVNRRNEALIWRCERRSTNLAKRARIEIREQQSALQDFFEETKGALYRLGIAD